MDEQRKSSLRQKILKEMIIDYSSVLEEYFDVAKKFIRLTKEGKVNIPVKDKLNGEEQILLYLIGKLYAKEAGFVTSEEVGNKELMEELNMPRGSLLPFLKRLRDKNKIEEIKKGRYVYHRIPLNLIGKILKDIQAKIETGGSI